MQPAECIKAMAETIQTTIDNLNDHVQGVLHKLIAENDEHIPFIRSEILKISAGLTALASQEPDTPDHTAQVTLSLGGAKEIQPAFIESPSFTTIEPETCTPDLTFAEVFLSSSRDGGTSVPAAMGCQTASSSTSSLTRLPTPTDTEQSFCAIELPNSAPMSPTDRSQASLSASASTPTESRRPSSTEQLPESSNLDQLQPSPSTSASRLTENKSVGRVVESASSPDPPHPLPSTSVSRAIEKSSCATELLISTSDFLLKHDRASTSSRNPRPATSGSVRNEPQSPPTVSSVSQRPAISAPSHADPQVGEPSSEAPVLEPSIECSVEDGIVSLFPTAEQYEDFPSLLHRAKQLGAGEVGVFKVVLPSGFIDPLKRLKHLPNTVTKYSTKPRGNGTYRVITRLTRSAHRLLGSHGLHPISPTELPIEVVKQFEKILHTEGLRDVPYYPDLDAENQEDRERLGLPLKSPIWPLRGNQLTRTKERIPGIHGPFAYIAPGPDKAIFAMHKDDVCTHAVNVLYEGYKYWKVIPSIHGNLLVDKSKETEPSSYLSNCDQVLRHEPTYYTTSNLDDWKIGYRIVCQRGGEVVVVFPNAYHEGFSDGYTRAEATNYADQDWTIQGYNGCYPPICPINLPRIEQFEFASEDDDRALDSPGQRRGLAREGKQAKSFSKQNKNKDHKSKRKLHNNFSPSKKQKIGDASGHLSSQAFECLSSIPKSIKQPPQIYQILSNRTATHNVTPEQLRFLTIICYATASPHAIAQLQAACVATRQQKLVVPRIGTNATEAMQILDSLETVSSIVSIVQRFNLAFLFKHYRERVDAQTQTSHAFRKWSGRELYKRPESDAWADLMAQTYPTLTPTRQCKAVKGDKYQKKLSSLKCRIRDGQNWYNLQERLGPGILTLVPVGGEYEITNHKVQRVPKSLFELFLDVLIEFRGPSVKRISDHMSHILPLLNHKEMDRKFRFEELNEQDLMAEPLDSQKLIDYCREKIMNVDRLAED